MAVNKILLAAAKEVVKLRRNHAKALKKITDKLDEKYVSGEAGEEAWLNSVPSQDRDGVLEIVSRIEGVNRNKQAQVFPDEPPTDNGPFEA